MHRKDWISKMLSENLKYLRKNRGLSQQQLSTRLNVTRQTISKWEKGLSVPDAELLLRIAEVLNVSVSDLMEETIVPEQAVPSLDTIAAELQKQNDLLAAQQARRSVIQKKILTVVAILLLLLFAGAIYDKWNAIFYDFGQNIYHWLH